MYWLCMYTIHSKHTHAVIYTTHKKFEPGIPRQRRCLHTQKQTHTHRQMHKQANVLHIAKGYPKKRKEKKKKKKKKKKRRKQKREGLS